MENLLEANKESPKNLPISNFGDGLNAIRSRTVSNLSVK
jgi:hypothetical protein